MTDNNSYAIVFAGQGAQKPGMGKSLYEVSPAAREVFENAGKKIMYYCFEAGDEELKQTEVTQPAVYTMGMAAYAALRESLKIDKGGFPAPSGLAGYSLGEYAAFTAAGVIDSLKTGLSLVKERSLFMKAAGTNQDGSQRGAMAAGVGSRDAVVALVEKAREDSVLEAVNFNSPGQTVVAGDMVAVKRFTTLAASDRSFGVKAIPLPVSGAFHSPIMRPAAEALASELENYTFGEPVIPVYLNSTGESFRGSGMDASANIRAIMVRQIQSPVYWQKTIEAMAAAGIGTIIEVGPGKTLTGLAKKIAPEITALHIEDAESLAETAERLRAGAKD